mgnify:CR=1 FL=1|tara:strand:- start:497 stop:742 length:246 start_codon:yes stop_codon:yes gene_type:complete
MLGSVIKYVGLPEGEHEYYSDFIGHVGYVTSYTAVASDGKPHVAVQWFEPHPVYCKRTTTYSHFGLERFEILSNPEEAKNV